MVKSEMYKMLVTAWLQWPNFAVTDALSGLWFEAFETEEKEYFWQALMIALKNNNSGYPPTMGQVNEILKSAKRITENEITEGEAWGLVQCAVRQWGYAQELKALEWIATQCEKTAAAARSIGWKEICACDIETLGVLRAHFWRSRAAMAARSDTARMLGLSNDVCNLIGNIGNLPKTCDQKVGS